MRNAVLLARRRRVHIDAQHLAEQRRQALTVLLGVAAGPAIAVRHVQKAVWAKCDRAAVVVPKRLLEPDQLLLGIRIAHRRIVSLHAESRHHVRHFRLTICVEREELTVLFELRMKGQAQEALFVLLVAIPHARGNIEEDFGLRRRIVVLEDVDDPFLLRHVHAVRAVAGMREQYGPERCRLAAFAAVVPAGPLQFRERQFECRLARAIR